MITIIIIIIIIIVAVIFRSADVYSKLKSRLPSHLFPCVAVCIQDDICYSGALCDVCRNKEERERTFRTKLNIFPLSGLYFLQTRKFAVVINPDHLDNDSLLETYNDGHARVWRLE